MTINPPASAIALLSGHCAERMPFDWQEKFAGYRFFYAPGYRQVLRRGLGENVSLNAFLKRAAAYKDDLKDELNGVVPKGWRNEIEAVQSADWTILGDDQLRYAFSGANGVFAKFSLSLILLQMMLQREGLAEAKSWSVFNMIKLHAAIFVFEGHSRKDASNLIYAAKNEASFAVATFQEDPDFIADFIDGKPCTYRTMKLIEAWWKNQLNAPPLGAITPLRARGQITCARRERVTLGADEEAFKDGI